MPSGPGALSGFIAKTASLISSSVGSRIRVAFISAVTFTVVNRKASSLSFGAEAVNRSVKYSEAKFSIPSSVSTQLPKESRSFVIRLRALLCFVLAWKNFVFLSPSLSQIARLFCLQNSSSSLYASHNFHFNSSSSSVDKLSSFWALSSSFLSFSISFWL